MSENITHIRKSRSSWGNNGCNTLCGLKVEYAPTVLSKTKPKNNCPDCIEILIDKKTLEIDILKEYLEVAKGARR